MQKHYRKNFKSGAVTLFVDLTSMYLTNPEKSPNSAIMDYISYPSSILLFVNINP
jgi:hypothetical protein